MKKCISGLLFCTVLSCMVIFSGSVLAEQIATTEKGQKVILLDNGTWKYVTNQDAIAMKLKTNTGSETDPFAKTVPKREDGSASYIDVIRKKNNVDFRDATWGMTRTQIKSLEKLKLLREVGDSLIYEYSLMGMNCLVIYIFNKDSKLLTGQYNIEQAHVNPALFNEDYDALKEYLRGLYGVPTSDQEIWKNETYKEDRAQWGFAVSIGFLSRYVAWKGSNAKIALQMSGENHKIFTSIKFTSLKG